MNKFIFLVIIAISFLACTKSESVLTLHENIYSDGEFDLVSYAGGRWAVIPSEEEYKFEVLLLDGNEKDFSQIINHISKELEQYTYDHTTLPTDIIPNCMNTAVFFLPNNRPIEDSEGMYWWIKGDVTVRLYTNVGYEDIIPKSALLTIYDMDKLIENCNE
jgi:hypothetical protein